MSTSNHSVQPALIFIPDISGFTRFVTDVEIDHSRHIIQELLEIMIESNEIELEISEIEGDAILFYRFGQAPTAAELMAQIQRMFVNFHKHLKKYETHRICQCGACKTANNLTLKFIAHYGDITINQVKNYNKLFGKDVIVAHRLLKNDIEHHEYALVTDNLVQACATWVDIPTVAWAPAQNSSQEYDSGKVNYCYFPLAPLMNHVPKLTIEDYSISGVTVPLMTSSGKIEAPIDIVFSIIADLPWRVKWIDGAKEVADYLNTNLFQNGSTHRCLANGPVVVTHNTQINKDLITFTETDTKQSFCAVYTLKKIDSQHTHISCTCFMKKNIIMNLIFRLFMKRKYYNSYEQTWVNLNDYCKALQAEGKTHHYQIVLDTPATQAA